MAASSNVRRHFEWWLDESALAHLVWARMMQSQDGITVRDIDGRLNLFETRDEAIAWLREDEYEMLSELVINGQVASDTMPPSCESNGT